MKYALAILLLVVGMLLTPDVQAQTESAALSWVPPTHNDDGSVLTDLEGYYIYYGQEPSGPYINSIQVADPLITTFIVPNLSSITHYFVMTAYNTAGVESIFSNEFVWVPPPVTPVPDPIPNPPTGLTAE